MSNNWCYKVICIQSYLEVINIGDYYYSHTKKLENGEYCIIRDLKYNLLGVFSSDRFILEIEYRNKLIKEILE